MLGFVLPPPSQKETIYEYVHCKFAREVIWIIVVCYIVNWFNLSEPGLMSMPYCKLI